MLRVTRPGGIAFISYTSWYGPWGGHETAPWHFLGGARARRRYAARHGHEPKNKYGESLFEVTVRDGARAGPGPAARRGARRDPALQPAVELPAHPGAGRPRARDLEPRDRGPRVVTRQDERPWSPSTPEEPPVGRRGDDRAAAGAADRRAAPGRLRRDPDRVRVRAVLGPDGRRHQVRPAHRSAPVPGLGAAAVGPLGGVRPAAEPGLRLRVADGPLLRGRRAGPAAALGGAAGLVVGAAVRGVLRRSCSWPVASTSAPPAPRCSRRSPSCSRRGSPRSSAAPRSRSGRWRWRRGCCCHSCIGSERGSVRRYAALSALVVATCGGVNAVAVAAVLPLGVIFLRHPGRRAAPVAAAGLVDAVHDAGHRVVVDPAAAARPLQRAVPRLHRERHDHHRPDRHGPDPGRGVQLGRLLRGHRLPGRPAAGVHALPDARRGRGGRPRADRHRPARQPAPTLPRPLGAHRAGPGRLRVRRRPGRLLRRGPCRSARRRARAAAQPAQVRRGAAHPAGAGAGARMAVLPKAVRTPESPGASRAAVLAVRAMAVLALVALALPWAQDRIAPRQGVDAVPAYWHKVADYLAADRRRHRRARGPAVVVRRLQLGQHPRRRPAGPGGEPVGGPQRDPAGPARQRRVPRRR